MRIPGDRLLADADESNKVLLLLNGLRIPCRSYEDVSAICVLVELQEIIRCREVRFLGGYHEIIELFLYLILRHGRSGFFDCLVGTGADVLGPFDDEVIISITTNTPSPVKTGWRLNQDFFGSSAALFCCIKLYRF